VLEYRPWHGALRRGVVDGDAFIQGAVCEQPDEGEICGNDVQCW
jgi:hypothetical protein